MDPLLTYPFVCGKDSNIEVYVKVQEISTFFNPNGKIQAQESSL